ncbi:MAG: CBS domain-containing protein [Nitrospinae bacterium]|nr:CBS domain-containing protein [Nitrospinota bacterium]
MRRIEYSTKQIKLGDMQAIHVMETEVTPCHENSTCEAIADILVRRGYGSLPVTDNEGNLLGIITEFDLLKILQEGKELGKETVKDNMTREVMFISPERPVKEVIDLLEDKRLIRVPVVKDGKLIGIVTRRDILYAVMKGAANYYNI